MIHLEKNPYPRESIVALMAAIFHLTGTGHRLLMQAGDQVGDITEGTWPLLLRACELIGNAYGISQEEVERVIAEKKPPKDAENMMDKIDLGMPHTETVDGVKLSFGQGKADD